VRAVLSARGAEPDVEGIPTRIGTGAGRLEPHHIGEQGAMIFARRGRLHTHMSATTCHMSISLDGFVAGPDQSLEHPLGRRGIELHHWHLDEPLHDADARARDLLLRPRGAYVMGRNMFGPIRGPWQEDWRGWWGDEPPYHAPVFVLTHYEHEPIELRGGTTFHFVTDGFDAAFARAKEAAGERGVDIAGGASTVRQALAAGVIDELVLDIVPALLGGGERIFDGVSDPGLEPVEVIHSPLATHVRYRVGAGGHASSG
jgi:dihydrofolate reductase